MVVSSGVRYPIETRVKAAARIASGESCADVARDVGCSEITVRTWAKQADISARVLEDKPEAAVSLRDKELTEPTRVTLGRMVADYVEVAIRSITVQAKVMGDEEWLRSQTAADVARVHAVLISKTTQFLAAIQPAFGGPPVEPDAGYEDLSSDYDADSYPDDDSSDAGE